MDLIHLLCNGCHDQGCPCECFSCSTVLSDFSLESIFAAPESCIHSDSLPNTMPWGILIFNCLGNLCMCFNCMKISSCTSQFFLLSVSTQWRTQTSIKFQSKELQKTYASWKFSSSPCTPTHPNPCRLHWCSKYSRKISKWNKKKQDVLPVSSLREKKWHGYC